MLITFKNIEELKSEIKNNLVAYYEYREEVTEYYCEKWKKKLEEAINNSFRKRINNSSIVLNGTMYTEESIDMPTLWIETSDTWDSVEKNGPKEIDWVLNDLYNWLKGE